MKYSDELETILMRHAASQQDAERLKRSDVIARRGWRFILALALLTLVCLVLFFGLQLRGT